MSARTAQIQTYQRPTSVDEAVAMKLEAGQQGFYLAGGSDALVFPRVGVATAIDITHLGLAHVHEDDGHMVIGATTLLRDIEKEDGVANLANGAFADSLRETAPWLIRNVATLAGNICNASPSADSAPMLLALDAELHLHDGRLIPLHSFFTGPHKTIIENELVIEIRLRPGKRHGWFRKHSRSKSDVAQVNIALAADVNGDSLHNVRVALGSVGPTPMRAKRTEDLLEGARLDREILDAAVRTMQSEISPIDDWRATARYRRHVAGVLLSRGLMELVSQGEGDR